MGYRTVKNVKRLWSYAEAKSWHDMTKPIRGRSPEIRPLAERRDVDTYSIRMNGDDVECVLYRTPVITFKPDNTVVLWMDKWNSVSTRQFIFQMLGIAANGNGNSTVLTLRNGEKHVLKASEKMTFHQKDQYQWVPTETRVLHGFKLSREKANTVRARYKPFYDYVNSMIKLRLLSSAHTVMEVHATEVMAYAENTSMRGHDDHGKYAWELVQRGSTEDYYGAFLRMCMATAKHWYSHRLLTDSAYVNRIQVKNLKDAINEMIMGNNALEVLESVPLAQGKVPDKKYARWYEFANQKREF